MLIPSIVQQIDKARRMLSPASPTRSSARWQSGRTGRSIGCIRGCSLMRPKCPHLACLSAARLPNYQGRPQSHSVDGPIRILGDPGEGEVGSKYTEAVLFRT